MPKTKQFINQYNWKKRFCVRTKRLEKFELNNKSIAHNILLVPYNTKK